MKTSNHLVGKVVEVTDQNTPTFGWVGKCVRLVDKLEPKVYTIRFWSHDNVYGSIPLNTTQFKLKDTPSC